MADSTTPTRVYQPAGVGLLQTIHDFKFATRTLAAAAVPAVTNFFGAAPNADPTLDRYDQSGTLVSSGKKFTIFQMALHIWKNTVDVNLGDFQLLIDNCFIRLVTNSKEFGLYPVVSLPVGGGLCIQSGQVAVTPVAAPGAFSTLGATNGHPLRKRFALKHPLEVQSNQSFYAELVAPQATPITMTSITRLRLELEGVEERTAS